MNSKQTQLGWHRAYLLVVFLLVSCSASAMAYSATANAPLAAPRIITAIAKTTSGAPVGIYITWTRSTAPSAIGYYLYRDTQSIPDPGPEGNLDPGLRVNSGALVDQPGEGDYVTHNDLFAPVIGQTYYYRVTVVDSLYQESYPSNEVSWTVHGHSVTGFEPTSAYYGYNITISGDTFGEYTEATDSVLFVAVSGGEVAGEIGNWTDTEITVTVPDRAITGKLSVVIDATVAQTDEELIILSPAIESITPEVGFVEQPLVINGVNFGNDLANGAVFLGAQDISSAVTAWQDTQIGLVVPESATADEIVVLVQGYPSNGVLFTPRAEILSTDLFEAQTGEPLVLYGRFFGETTGRVLLDDTTELAISSWTDDIVQTLLTGEVGDHTLTVETAAGNVSNEFSYPIIEPLYVVMSGIDSLVTYLADSPPYVKVETAVDAEVVELLVDGVPYDDTNPPTFYSMRLPVSAMNNGSHEVKLRATRRTIVVESDSVTVTVYSLVGDINADGIVDEADRDELQALLLLPPEILQMQRWYDTNEDGELTEADLSAVGYNYGEEIALPPL